MLLEHYQCHLAWDFDLEVGTAAEQSGRQDVLEGRLVSRTTGRDFPIRRGLPRFVPDSGYADSFGYQWNLFRATQLDSHTGLSLTADRFWRNTRWTPEALRGKTVLEAGSGAGRFTEILLGTPGVNLVSFDYSTAVDANRVNNPDPGLFLFQGDIFDLPLAPGGFDFVFCHGVLQHTPDPGKAFARLIEHLKPGGRFSIDIYRKMRAPAPWYFPKYFWRPITTRMRRETLLKILKLYIPVWLPLDTLIKYTPLIGHTLSGCLPIPCWNHLGCGLTYKQRLEWAIMDTFDALSPRYDIPKTVEDLQAWCERDDLRDVEIFPGGNGLVVNGTKVR